jgi:hypothetical protein
MTAVGERRNTFVTAYLRVERGLGKSRREQRRCRTSNRAPKRMRARSSSSEPSGSCAGEPRPTVIPSHGSSGTSGFSQATRRVDSLRFVICQPCSRVFFLFRRCDRGDCYCATAAATMAVALHGKQRSGATRDPRRAIRSRGPLRIPRTRALLTRDRARVASRAFASTIDCSSGQAAEIARHGHPGRHLRFPSNPRDEY